MAVARKSIQEVIGARLPHVNTSIENIKDKVR